VLLDHNKVTLQECLNQLQPAFEINIQGDMNKYLGIKIDRHTNGTIHLSQLQLIDTTLIDLKLLDENINILNNT
jgi:hypothetical protein